MPTRRRLDARFTRMLERGEISPDAFHHRDHLRVAWVYLEESSTVDEAVARMAATLRRLAAAAAGKPDTYSDRVTAFWMYQMASARAWLPDADCAMLLRAFPHLGDKTFPSSLPRVVE